MSLLARAALATVLVLGAMPLACDGGGPRMRVVTTQVSAGDRVVVRFDAPPVDPQERGGVWLTLVPAGSADELVGDRVVIEAGATEATITTGAQGAHELRLFRCPSRPSRPSRLRAHILARAQVDVGRPVLARNEPPAWYW